MEAGVIAAFEAEGVKVRRGHPYNAERGHGFISSQRIGMDAFMGIRLATIQSSVLAEC